MTRLQFGLDARRFLLLLSLDQFLELTSQNFTTGILRNLFNKTNTTAQSLVTSHVLGNKVNQCLGGLRRRLGVSLKDDVGARQLRGLSRVIDTHDSTVSNILMAQEQSFQL